MKSAVGIYSGHRAVEFCTSAHSCTGESASFCRSSFLLGRKELVCDVLCFGQAKHCLVPHRTPETQGLWGTAALNPYGHQAVHQCLAAAAQHGSKLRGIANILAQQHRQGGWSSASLQSFTRHYPTARQLTQTGSGFIAPIQFQHRLNLLLLFKSSIISEQSHKASQLLPAVKFALVHARPHAPRALQLDLLRGTHQSFASAPEEGLLQARMLSVAPAHGHAQQVLPPGGKTGKNSNQRLEGM